MPAHTPLLNTDPKRKSNARLRAHLSYLADGLGIVRPLCCDALASLLRTLIIQLPIAFSSRRFALRYLSRCALCFYRNYALRWHWRRLLSQLPGPRFLPCCGFMCRSAAVCLVHQCGTCCVRIRLCVALAIHLCARLVRLRGLVCRRLSC